MDISLYDGLEVINMCYVTATELKNNLSYYLEKSKEEEVYITKNNKVISVLINPQLKALYEFDQMARELNIQLSEEDQKKSYKELIGECIEEKCGY